jgi:hypothetical protein
MERRRKVHASCARIEKGGGPLTTVDAMLEDAAAGLIEGEIELDEEAP